MRAVDTATLVAAGADAADDDDSGLRWGVAGVVAALPLFGFLAWLLPAMLPPPESQAGEVEVPGSSPSGDGITHKYFAFSLLYLVAFASHGFNPSDGGVWGITAACAAHLQLERLAAAAARAGELSAGRARGSCSASDVARTAISSPGKQSKAVSMVRRRGGVGGAGGAAGEEGISRGAGAGDPAGDTAGAAAGGAAGSDWGGGSDPWAGMVPKLPEMPELSVKGLGRALGATQLAAAKLRRGSRSGVHHCPR
jgi:hypothetical protein